MANKLFPKTKSDKVEGTGLTTSNKINALAQPVKEIVAVSKLISDSEKLELKKDLKNLIRLGRKPIDKPNHNCYSILPGSSHSLIVKISSDSSYIFQTSENSSDEEEGNSNFTNRDFDVKRKIVLNESDGDELLRAIRTSQLITNAFASRLIEMKVDEDKYAFIPDDFFSLLNSIEDMFDSDSRNISDVTKFNNSLINVYSNRINNLRDSFNKLGLWLNKTHDSKTPLPETTKQVFLSNKTETAYLTPRWDVRELGDYLGSTKPTEYNQDTVRNVIKSALKQLLLPTEWIIERSSSSLGMQYPFPTLDQHGAKDSYYNEFISSCRPIYDALKDKLKNNPSDSEKLEDGIAECKKLMEISEGPLSTENLVESPHQILTKKLDEITVDYELFESMKTVLKNILPGLYASKLETFSGQDKLKTELSTAYQKTANIRYDVTECKKIIEKVRDLIRDKSTSKDFENKREPIEEESREHQLSLQTTLTEKLTEEELGTKIETLKKTMLTWQNTTEMKLSKVSSDDSVLWIGLGQAGGQILRECILYCLENLNDARCTALLRSLGVDKENQKVITDQMKKLHSSDKSLAVEAKQDIQKIAHDNLHILAMNLGEEIDDLVKTDAPGYYIWGKEVDYEKNARVTRGRMNTLKLKASGEGAGGRTGLGRAYGFKFYNEIADVMGQVGSKGSRTPKHIVITHSFAGGSGSGMILPVLQQARRKFGSEAIIWVMSVGGGAAETKVAAHFNTPFILSDILQAHYDGIHAVMSPIDYTQWSIFKDGINRHRVSMLSKLKELIVLSGESEVEDPEIMLKFEALIDVRNTEQLIKKRHTVFTSLEGIQNSRTPEGYTISPPEYSDEEMMWKNISNGNFFTELENILPANRTQTKTFNNWCEVQERGGKRPALSMWMKWIECMSDPLGYFIKGREKGNTTKADSDSDSAEQQFIPSLTSDNLDAVLANVHMNKGLKSEFGREAKTLPTGLRPLEDVLGNLFKMDSEKNEAIFTKLVAILGSYGDSLDQYNQMCEQLTAQVLSMAGTSSDARIKSIIVSNSHLELGAVATPNLEISGSTYTVYNSVIFDLMLNIIGPRLPTEAGIFINTDAEEFDQQDLITQTKPPMVVGLLNQRDSISLEESPLVTDKLTIEPSNLQEILNSIFSSPNACTGLVNPLNVFTGFAPDEIRQLFISFFGKRHLYLLQHNPYDGIVKQVQSPSLNTFISELISKWESNETVYDSSSEVRKNIALTNGLTSSHIGNIFNWFSLIGIDSLCRILTDTKEKFLELKNKLQESEWSSMVLSPTSMDLGIFGNKPTIGAFSKLEESRVNEDTLYQVLPNMGIRNIDILRTVSASYLNSYLPAEILLHEGEGKISTDNISFKSTKEISSEKMKEVVDLMLLAIIKSHSLNNLGELDMADELVVFNNKSIFEATNQLLEKYGLVLSLNSKSESYHINLHPKLSRYLSVVRDVPMQSKDLLLPARNTGASLARYLHYTKPASTSIASPTFVLGGDIMNYMRYLGLLPDEKRLSLVPFLRIILLGDGSSAEFKTRLETQVKCAGINLDLITELLEEIFDKNPYQSLEIYERPQVYCDHASVLQSRLLISRAIVERLSENMPSGWNNNDRIGLNAWLEITSEDNDIVLGIENFGVGEYAISRVKDWLHNLRSLTTISFNSRGASESDIDETVEENIESQIGAEPELDKVGNENTTIISIKQLFFDMSSLLNESLGQAEYMADDSKNSRVHFEMTGFSDRLIGKPSGLLALIHDRNPKLGMDAVRESVRDGIQTFLGKLADPKEYFTAADFGPTSYVTMVFQQAPFACIAEEFSAAVADLNVGLGSRNPDKYQDITRLHPYIFLYNMLWLPTKIDEWTDAANSDFIRYFQIPTRVIQHHYQNPKSISVAVNSIETHESYKNGQVQMPGDDLRDMQNAMNKDRKHLGVRNIVPLLGTMALRHENAGELHSEKLWKSHLEDEQYQELVEKWAHKGKILAEKIYLDPDLGAEEAVKAAESTEIGALLGGLGVEISGLGSSSSNDPDTLKTRTIEWFKAYSDWLAYTDDNETDKLKI